MGKDNKCHGHPSSWTLTRYRLRLSGPAACLLAARSAARDLASSPRSARSTSQRCPPTITPLPSPPLPACIPGYLHHHCARPGVAMPKGHSSVQQVVSYYQTYPAAHLWPLLAATAPCADEASLNSTNAVPLPRPVVRSITSLRACPPAGDTQTRDILLKAALSPPSDQHQRPAAAVRAGDKHQIFLRP